MIEERKKYNLIRGIKDIPEESPNPDLWGKIEKDLDYIENLKIQIH